MGPAGVHRVATAFSLAAPAYEAARPGYPPEALAWLAARAAIGPGDRVVDLAAGTGKLTRALAARGAAVVAVEPVAGMRAALSRAAPSIPVIAGVAEAIPLGTATADALTVAQAFHWFATAPALDEMHRVLRRESCLVLVWNRRDLSDPLQARLNALMAPFRGDAPSFESGAWHLALDDAHRARCFAADGELQMKWSQPTDVDGVVARVESVSFVADLSEAARTRLLAEVRHAASERPLPLTLPYTTEVYCYRRCA
jgi:SAM-dependent methyltransferase